MPVIWFQNLYFAQIGCLSPTPSKPKNRNAELIERVICSEERDLFLNYTPWTSTYLGFLPLSFHPSWPSIRALAGGEVCGCSLKSLHARQLLSRQCQHRHKSPPWWARQQSDCAVEQVSFWCLFFWLLDLSVLVQQNFCQTPATSWPGTVSSLLQRLCSHRCDWTGRGLTLISTEGGQECEVQSEWVAVKQHIEKKKRVRWQRKPLKTRNVLLWVDTVALKQRGFLIVWECGSSLLSFAFSFLMSHSGMR